MLLEKNKRTTNAGKFLIVLLAAISAIGPLSTDMYLPAFPQICSDLEISASYIQFTLTAWLIGLACGQIITGPLSDVFGRKKPLVSGIIIFTITTASCAFVGSIKIFILLRLIGGFAAAAALVVSRAIASDLYKGSLLTKFLSTVMVIQGLAPILAPVIGGQLLIFFTWRSVFVLLTIIGSIIALLGIFHYKESLLPANRIDAHIITVLNVFVDLCRDHYFAGISTIQFFIFSALFAYISGMPFILQNIYGFSPQQFSIVFAVVGIGMVISGQATNILTEKIREEKLLLIGLMQSFIFSTLFLIGILQNWNIYILLATLLLAETGLPSASAASFSLAMRGRNNAAGSVSALLGFFSTISGGIIAPIVGIAGPNTALPTAITIFVCETIAMIAFIGMVKGKSSHK